MATTGVSQQTLNSLLNTGQNSSIDAGLNNFQSINANINNLQLSAPRVNPVVLDATNAPNTSTQNRQLGNAVFGLNAQTFNTQSAAIQNSTNQQLQTLGQQAKDTNAQNLQMFGQSAFLSGSESSRNASFLTDTTTRLNQAANNVTNNALDLLNQNALNFSQANVQALGQARTLDFQDRQQQFSEDRALSQETGNQYIGGRDTNTRTLAGKGFDLNSALSIANLTGEYDGKLTMAGQQNQSSLISNRLNQALGFSSFTGKNPTLEGLMDTKNLFDPTKQNNERTLAQANFEDYEVPLAQARIEQANLQAELAKAQNTPEYLQLYRDLLTSNANLNILQNEQTKAQIGQIAGFNQDFANSLTSVSDTLTAYQSNPTPETAEAFSKAQGDLYNKVGSELGKLYRTPAAGSPLYNPDGTVNLDADRDTIKQGLLKHGFNGNATFSSDNPNMNKALTDVKNELKDVLLKDVFPAGSTASQINKIFFSATNDNNKALVALRTKNDKGEATGGYQYMSLDMTNMDVSEKAKLQQAISEGKIDDEQTSQSDLKSLDRLMEVINASPKLIKQDMGANDFQKRMQDYGVAERETIPGIKNQDFMNLALLSSYKGGVALIGNDTNLINLAGTATDLKTLTNNINSKISGLPNPQVVNTDAIIRDLLKNNNDGTSTLVDIYGNQIKGSDNKPIVFSSPLSTSTIQTINQLKTYKGQADSEEIARNALKAILQNVGGGVQPEDFNKLGGSNPYGASILDPIFIQ
jgi:hypothetical protein